MPPTTSTSVPGCAPLVVEVTGLRKSYGGRTAVDGVSFTVDEGEIFKIPGPNGAGKTTTVACVEGLRVPDAGRVRVAGHPVRQALRRPQQRLFIALALIGNPRIVVLDELTTGLDPRARRDTWNLIEDVRANGVTVLLVTYFMG
ncbi:ABC transporter ATP-binding protein [Streptomyces sp. MA5143a]|uniref:ABC transporter ATP-binding protein n=1 Tax=Streptomyces sp. MA5143a TaxID=2083010 RepID=UPI0035BFD0AF